MTISGFERFPGSGNFAEKLQASSSTATAVHPLIVHIIEFVAHIAIRRQNSSVFIYNAYDVSDRSSTS